MNDAQLSAVQQNVNVTKSGEQMLKMKPQHWKQGNMEYVQCVQCTVCIVRTVYSTCK